MTDEPTAEATDRPANGRPHRGWFGMAIGAAVMVVVLRGIGPFHSGYARAGLVVAFAACYSLVEWLVRRSYQRD